jgi:hypothetical protein
MPGRLTYYEGGEMDMKKIETVNNQEILLPESVGNCIQWYGFRVSYQDMDKMSEDGADCQFFAPDKYRVVMATGRVGFDALPSLSMGEAQYLGGSLACRPAGHYLLRELHLLDSDIFTLDEQLQGYAVNVVISPHPVKIREMLAEDPNPATNESIDCTDPWTGEDLTELSLPDPAVSG